MTAVQLHDLKGNASGEVKLADDVFGRPVNEGLIHAALMRQLANARRGSASTKTRAEVSGGGAKPWRQKGTGRARAGSNTSPLWLGGGVTFGPKPRDYSQAMPKKMRQAALKSALSATTDKLVVLKDLAGLDSGKTKEFASALKALKMHEKKVLVILDFACDTCAKVEQAARNIADTKVIHINNLNVKDLLHADHIFTTERTVNAIGERFATGEAQPEKSESPEKKAAKPKKESPAKKVAAETAEKKPAKKEKTDKDRAS